MLLLFVTTKDNVIYGDKQTLDLYNLNIVNYPEEKERVGKLLNDCIDATGTESAGLIRYERADVFNFICNVKDLFLDTVQTDTILQKEDLRPKWVGKESANLCIVEIKQIDFEEINKIYEIAGEHLWVAIICNSNLTNKYRYNFLYKN